MYQANLAAWLHPKFKVQLLPPHYLTPTSGKTGLTCTAYATTPANYQQLRKLGLSAAEISEAFMELLHDAINIAADEVMTLTITPENLPGTTIGMNHHVEIKDKAVVISAVVGLDYRTRPPEGITQFVAFMLESEVEMYIQERRRGSLSQ
jgi:hypothetical protein